MTLDNAEQHGLDLAKAHLMLVQAAYDKKTALMVAGAFAMAGRDWWREAYGARAAYDLCQKLADEYIEGRGGAAMRQTTFKHRNPVARGTPLIERLEKYYMPVTECGCWIWMAACYRFGHGQLVYNKQHIAAHRASWSAFRGPIPDGMHVLHKCNIPQCINPDHLYLHPMAKINTVIARQIKDSPLSNKAVSRELGVGYQTVFAIRSGRQWRNA